MAIHLIQQFYVSKDDLRNKELKSCYSTNVKNTNIKFHQLVEPETLDYINLHFAKKKKPTTLMKHDERLTFYEALKFGYEYANEGDIIIISNSDVALDPLITFKHFETHQNRLPQSLSRWQIDEKEWTNFDRAYILNDLQQTWTHDAWCFERNDKLLEFIQLLPNKQLTFGLYGGDSELDCYIYAHWRTIFNDFNLYKIYHFHGFNNFREWKPEMNHPFGYMLLTYGEGVYLMRTNPPEGLWLKETKDFNEFILSCLRVLASFEQSQGIKLKMEDIINFAGRLKPLNNSFLKENLEKVLENYFRIGYEKGDDYWTRALLLF